MVYKSQKIAIWFFATSLLLLGLQLLYGFVLVSAHFGYDTLHPWIPFHVARSTHANLLVMSILAGFMGAAYYIIPEESKTDVAFPKLAYLQLIALVVVGVTAIIGFHFNWWEGRKFLEIPRPLDYLVVVDFLLFLFLVGHILWRAPKRTATSLVLFYGLLFTALLYLPGMINTDLQVLDSFWRWWVVHLWVEGVWELIMASVLTYLLIKITGVDRKLAEKWLYFVVALALGFGILGTGHHYYFVGTPKYWMWIGGAFSLLEPLSFLALLYYILIATRSQHNPHPRHHITQWWVIGCGVMAFLGAGILGVAHTLPSVNLYTHGTMITAMHGHLSFWGAYVMLVLAIISYITATVGGEGSGGGLGKKRLARNRYAFWASNVGILVMTAAFAVAGITQVYLERMAGLDFMGVQKAVEVHFMVAGAGALFLTSGILAFIWDFIQWSRTERPIVVKEVPKPTREQEAFF